MRFGRHAVSRINFHEEKVSRINVRENRLVREQKSRLPVVLYGVASPGKHTTQKSGEPSGKYGPAGRQPQNIFFLNYGDP